MQMTNKNKVYYWIIFLLMIPWAQLFYRAFPSVGEVQPVHILTFFEYLYPYVILSFILMYSRVLFFFGAGIVIFQRLFETILYIIQGRFVSGMTNATVQSLFLFPQHQIDDVISSQLPVIVFGSLSLLLCVYFYIKMAKILSRDFNSKRKFFSKKRLITTEILCISVFILAISNKTHNDIFFFEDVSDKFFIQPILVEKGKPISKNEGVDFDIDFYYVRGESTSPSHMSLYGYERKTTP